MYKLFRDYIRIIAGVTLLAAAVTVFYDPNKVVTGGVSGLCIIISAYAKQLYDIDLSLGLLNIVLNLPLLAVGYFVLGKAYIFRTVIATSLFSVALQLTAHLPHYNGDLFIVSIFGGVISGAGVGLTIMSFATTGGSDLFGSIVHKLSRHIAVAKAMFVFDALVIMIGLLQFGVEKGLYAIISVYIASVVVDRMLEGLSFSTCAFIVSAKYEAIAEDIMKALDRGVTGLSGKGMYTDSGTTVLMCVVAKKEIYTLKQIVRERDSAAFVIVSDVREALGEGFAAH